MVVRVGMSWNLGVKPARTTLSEAAMHSMISKRSVSVSQEMGPASGTGGCLPPLR